MSHRRSITLFAALALTGVLASPAQASAKAPSNATLVFKVPSTISSASLDAATIPGIVSWTQGKSATPGVSCCTNSVYEFSTLLATTKASHLKVTLASKNGYSDQGEGLRIDSYDANGVYVGTAYAYDQVNGVNEFTSFADDSSTFNSQGNWATRTDAKSLGGSVEYSTASGATAIFMGYIRDFAWITTTGPTHGDAAVYVNGQYVAGVSTYSATIHRRRVVFQQSWPIGGSADQTIEIINLGTTGHSEVDVDGEAVISED